ncbi:MAG: glycosyl hydrolase-related protein [Phototrophicaceae bacterium]
MVEAPTNSQTILYIIHHIAWQREGQATFDAQRAQLLDKLVHILDTLQSSDDDSHAVVLGSETILLSDIAQINPTLLSAMTKALQQETLVIGPWYIQIDGILAHGEAFIRSLLLGQADSLTYNIPLSKIAIMPDNYQGNPQHPQILQNFGIDAIIVQTEQAIMALPFNWVAPNGNHVLVIPYQILDNVEDALQKQGKFQPDGPFIWVNHTDDGIAAIPDDLSAYTPVASTFDALVTLIRERLPDQYRPILSNTLYIQPISQNSGRFAARISLKQAILRLIARLLYQTEPLLALASVFGDQSSLKIQKSLLDHSWRLLLQNMSPTTFAGAVNDATHDEMLLRNRQVEDNSQHVIDKALQHLAGKRYNPQTDFIASETYITVWNPHGHDVEQIVELGIDLPQGLHPNILIAPSGEEQAFTWDKDRHVIDFRADVPAVGYAVYTLKISRDQTADYNQRRAVAGRSIGTASGESLGLVGGRLDWTFANGNIIDLLTYHDGGDAGDVWQYQEPQPDVVMKGSIVDVIQVEATPTYERLIFRNRMRIAPNLKEGKERVRGLRVLELTTTATYHNGLSGIHFRTEFTNTAEDHRLRVHLRSGIQSNKVYTDSAFSIQSHIISAKNNGDLPLQSMAIIGDDKRALGIFTRGLLAVEPLQEDKQVTMALTLLRSVGMLNQTKRIPAIGAQMSGDFVTEFMVLPLDAQLDKAQLTRTSMSYKAPLQAYQYAEKPDAMRHSYLSYISQHCVITAIKPPQSQTGLIVRLQNTSNQSDAITLIPHRKLRQATLLSLAEKPLSDVGIRDGHIQIDLQGNDIKTLLLQF